LSVAEELLARSGYRFIIGQTHRNLANYQSYIRDFVSRRVEAIICFSHEYSDFDISTEFSDLRKVIFLNRPQVSNSHYVDVDIVTGIESIVGHLYERGRRRIGLWLSGNSGLSGQRREQGYRQGLTLHGLDYDPGFIHRTGGFRPGRNECDAALEHFVRVMKADAIIAQNDLWGIKLLKGLLQAGVHVPSDIAVTGVDNLDFSQFTHPSLTTLDQDCRNQGEKITAMMQRILVDETASEPQHVIISPKLIIREST